MNVLLRTTSVLALFAAALAASAAPIVYTVAATASGTLDGVAFTNASFALRGIGDTSTSRLMGVENYENAVAVTVFVSGLATDTLAGAPVAFTEGSAGSPPPYGGIASASESSLVLGVVNPAFTTYDLKSAIGPLSGDTLFLDGTAFTTSRGRLVLTNATNATFTAAVNPTPEPSAFAALGLGGLAALRRRKRA